jgi:mannose-1-phosphate guanylyltransferase/phosphomannomutase
MLPIGPKPALQYVIESLADEGFDEIIVTTNYLQEQIENYFGDGSRFEVTLRYPKEEKPLGTAGSVKNAERFLDETFALIQGDNITDVNLAGQVKYHRRKKAIATLSVMQFKEPWKYGVVKLGKENEITGFQEKPPREKCESNLINTGLYVLEPDVLELIPSGTPFDFAKDVFPIILKAGKPLYGYQAKGFWTDIGSVEGFLEASMWLLKKLKRSVSTTAEINRARIKGLVCIGDGTTLETGVKVQGPAYIGDSCTILKDVSINPGTILGHKVNVGERSTLNSASVFGSTEVHSNVTLNHCILDEKCEIGSNSKIDDYAIVGVGCRTGENVVIGPGVKLEPGSRVERGKVIRT